MALFFALLLAVLAVAACFAAYARPLANVSDDTSTPAVKQPDQTAGVVTLPSAPDTPTAMPTPTSTWMPTPTATPLSTNLLTKSQTITISSSVTIPVEMSLVDAANELAAFLALTVTQSLVHATELTQTAPLSNAMAVDETVIDRGEPLAETIDDLPILSPTPAPVPDAPRSPTSDGVARTVQVPILMYHYVSVPPADANIYRLDLSVTPELFGEHLDRMAAEGYTTISLYGLLNHLTTGKPLPEKPVIITFDDGYRDNYVNAFPRLAERDMTATFFVVTDFIDEERPEYLTWEMLREMNAVDMFIESHGRNHVSLKDKDIDYLVWQALGSYEAIERELGQRPRFVSYPAGQYDRATMDLFESANYWAGLTTVQGATHDSDNLFELHRVRVRGSTTPDELIRLLELDW